MSTFQKSTCEKATKNLSDLWRGLLRTKLLGTHSPKSSLSCRVSLSRAKQRASGCLRKHSSTSSMMALSEFHHFRLRRQARPRKSSKSQKMRYSVASQRTWWVQKRDSQKPNQRRKRKTKSSLEVTTSEKSPFCMTVGGLARSSRNFTPRLVASKRRQWWICCKSSHSSNATWRKTAS